MICINLFLLLFLHLYQFFYAIYYLAAKPYINEERIKIIEIYFQEYFGKSIIYHKIKILETCLLIFNIHYVCLFCCFCCNCEEEDLKDMLPVISIDLAIQSILFGIAFWLLWEVYFFYENQKSNSIILNLLIMVIHISLYYIFFIANLIVHYFLK